MNIKKEGEPMRVRLFTFYFPLLGDRSKVLAKPRPYVWETYEVASREYGWAA